jgi:predicted nucleotidyltransferase
MGVSATLASDALGTAREIAHFLKTKYGASRVVLFGSLADGFYRERSDIDIYFEGVPSDRIFAAVGHCLEVFRGTKIDLQPSSFCEESFRERVLKEGITLE